MRRAPFPNQARLAAHCKPDRRGGDALARPLCVAPAPKPGAAAPPQAPVPATGGVAKNTAPTPHARDHSSHLPSLTADCKAVVELFDRYKGTNPDYKHKELLVE